jgi:hypothetical protein
VDYAAEDEEIKGKHGGDDEMRDLANIAKNEGFEKSSIWQNEISFFTESAWLCRRVVWYLVLDLSSENTVNRSSSEISCHLLIPLLIFFFRIAIAGFASQRDRVSLCVSPVREERVAISGLSGADK